MDSNSSLNDEKEEGTTNQPTDLHRASMPSKVLHPEEPLGPKSRLVIYKLMLINFKSYAGRQEIGPFHKVEGIMLSPVRRLINLLVLLSHRRS